MVYGGGAVSLIANIIWLLFTHYYLSNTIGHFCGISDEEWFYFEERYTISDVFSEA